MDFEAMLQEFLGHLAAAKRTPAPVTGSRFAQQRVSPEAAASIPSGTYTLDDVTAAAGRQIDPVLSSPVAASFPPLAGLQLAAQATGTGPGELAGRVAPYLNPYTAMMTAATHIPRAAQMIGQAIEDPSLQNMGQAGMEAGSIPLSMLPGGASSAKPVLNALARAAPKLGWGALVGGAGMTAASDFARAEEPQKTRQDFIAARMPPPFDPVQPPTESNSHYRHRRETYDSLVEQARKEGDKDYATYMTDVLAQKKATEDTYNSRSFGENYPGLATGIGVAGNVLAAVLAKRGIASANKWGKELLSRAEDALNPPTAKPGWFTRPPSATAAKTPNLAAYARAANEAKAWSVAAPWMKAGAIAGAATIPWDARQMGDLIYSQTLPIDAPARKHYEKRFTAENLPNLAVESARDLLSGVTSATIGSKLIPGGSNPRGPVNALAQELYRLPATRAPADQALTLGTRLRRAEIAGRALAQERQISAASARDVSPTLPSPGGTGPTSGTPGSSSPGAGATGPRTDPQLPAVSGQNPSSGSMFVPSAGQSAFQHTEGHWQFKGPDGRWGPLLTDEQIKEGLKNQAKLARRGRP